MKKTARAAAAIARKCQRSILQLPHKVHNMGGPTFVSLLEAIDFLVPGSSPAGPTYLRHTERSRALAKGGRSFAETHGSSCIGFCARWLVTAGTFFSSSSIDARAVGSCPLAWCSSLRATTITGLGREDQAARVGRLTRGSSPIGAMLSRVM